MAFAEKHGNWYRLVFRLDGKRFTHKLKSKKKDIANGIVGGGNRTLMLIKQQVLQIPETADVVDFVLTGGQVVKPAEVSVQPADAKNGNMVTETTFEQLKDRYLETLAVGGLLEDGIAFLGSQSQYPSPVHG